MNEKGNSTLFSLMCLMIVTLVGLTSINEHLDSFVELKKQVKLHLCSKELNGVTRNYVIHIESLNLAIEGSNYLYLIPVIAPFVKYGKKGLQLTQEVFKIFYMIRLAKMGIDGCLFIPSTSLSYSPYGMFFKRDIKGIATILPKIKLKGKWTFNTTTTDAAGLITSELTKFSIFETDVKTKQNL